MYFLKIHFFLIFFLTLRVFPSTYDYLFRHSSPSFNSYGSVGLIQMPNARFLESGSTAFTYSDFNPYSRISFVGYPFEWFEAIYQYTDIQNKLYSESFLFSGNQTYKDKGFDIKIKLLNETDHIPQIAIGLRDIGGTGLFSSEYLVISKYYRNFDFTLGVGWGLLSNSRFRNPLSELSPRFDNRGSFQTSNSKGGEFSFDSFFRGKNIGVFGGAEVFLTQPKNLRFKIEYDSTNYDDEGFDSQNISSRTNYALLYSLNENFNISMGWIKGNTLQLGFSLALNLANKNKQLSKINSYKSIERKEALQNVTALEDKYFYRAALLYLNDREIYLRSSILDKDNNAAEVAFSQNKFRSYPVSYGRAFRTLEDLSPINVDTFTLIPMNNIYELAKVTVDRAAFNRFEKTGDYYSLKDYISISPPKQETKNHSFKPVRKFPNLFWKVGPDIQSHIGGPDRFYVGGLNLRFDSELLIHPRLSLQTIARQSLVTTFDVLNQPSDSILPHVRTDLIEYLKESQGTSISRMQFNSFWNPHSEGYLKLSYGIFEEMFGGYGFEYLYRPFYKRFAFGIELYKAKQRSYRQLLSYKDYSITTGHLTYYHAFNNNILLKIVGGKYLAGDSGITLDLSRRFKSGLTIGAFATKTDISSEEFGEGSFDKGFYVNIPLENIFPIYSRQLTNFGLRPVTRDGGAKLIIGHELYGVTDQASYINIFRDINDIYD